MISGVGQAGVCRYKATLTLWSAYCTSLFAETTVNSDMINLKFLAVVFSGALVFVGNLAFTVKGKSGIVI